MLQPYRRATGSSAMMPHYVRADAPAFAPEDRSFHDLSHIWGQGSASF